MNAIARNVLRTAAAIGTALAINAVVAVSPASAAETGEVSSVIIRVGDLDAHTVHGAKHIYFRLQRAAGEVCGDDVDKHGRLYLMTLLRNCEQQVIEPVVERIDTAPLTAIYTHQFPERRGTVETGQVG
jgi:UrcA family protein